MSESYPMTPIGTVQSVFKEKFGTPRQSGVVPSAQGVIHFHPPYDQKEAFLGLDGFSHLWIISLFHLSPAETFRPMVRPPKLGGTEKVGVFSSRAPYRPSRLCLTAVKLEEILEEEGKIRLRVSGLDLVDGTPVLDVKPYVPYADAYPEAEMGFALAPPAETLPVRFPTDAASPALTTEEIQLLTETLQARPDPAYAHPRQGFGLTLGDLNIRWEILPDEIKITEITREA